MKWFLALATVISLTATAVIYAWPSHATKNSETAFNSTLYFAQKLANSNVKTSPQGFTQLLDTWVLGASTSAPQEPVVASLTDAYTIAVIGDSMVDTLGPGLPHLEKALTQDFPEAKFKLLNYGLGASDMAYGISRLTTSYNYLGTVKPALLSQNPDVIVIESFAYNHWENNQSDLDRHWLAIAKMISTVKELSPHTKIILAATVAPYCPTFTDGSANLPVERKYKECDTVKAYLQNIVNFATSEKYVLVDAYHPSLKDGEGNPKYINQGDHIHPSDEGKELFSRLTANAIYLVLTNK